MCVAGSIPTERERQALPGGRGRALTSATWLRPCQRSGPAGSGPHPCGPTDPARRAGVPPTPGWIFGFGWCVCTGIQCARSWGRKSVHSVPKLPHFQRLIFTISSGHCGLKTPSLSHSFASESYSQCFQINSHYNGRYQESQ